MRIPMVIVAVLLLAPGPAPAATRGECEAGVKRLVEVEPDVKPRFRGKFNQERARALEAQKKQNWDGCAAAAAEALRPGRPTGPEPAR